MIRRITLGAATALLVVGLPVAALGFSQSIDTDYTPTAIPGAQPVAWPSSPAWEALGLSSPGQVRFRYATVAGQPGTATPANSNLDPNKFWYAAQAEGDLNEDGNSFILEVYSDSRIMFNSATGTGGWE